MSTRPDQFHYTKDKGGDMAQQPANKNEAAGAAPAKPKGNVHFPKAATQAGMAAALMATMILNVPMFQHAATNDIKGMVIFEVVLMFICTASVGVLAMACTQNFARGISEELRRNGAKPDVEG